MKTGADAFQDYLVKSVVDKALETVELDEKEKVCLDNMKALEDSLYNDAIKTIGNYGERPLEIFEELLKFKKTENEVKYLETLEKAKEEISDETLDVIEKRVKQIRETNHIYGDMTTVMCGLKNLRELSEMLGVDQEEPNKTKRMSLMK